jgi:hypothetical protein
MKAMQLLHNLGQSLWEGWDLHQIAAWKKDQLNRSPKGAYVIQ